jgi:hypothetical protein
MQKFIKDIGPIYIYSIRPTGIEKLCSSSRKSNNIFLQVFMILSRVVLTQNMILSRDVLTQNMILSWVVPITGEAFKLEK